MSVMPVVPLEPLPDFTCAAVRPVVGLVSPAAKLAAIVWLALTLVNVYELTALTDEPSTSTPAIKKHGSAVIVKD